MLPVDLKIGEMYVLHEGNHNNFGNPHPQYVPSSFHYFTGQRLINGQEWTKIAHIDIKSSDVLTLKLGIATGSIGVTDKPKFGDLYLRIRLDAKANNVLPSLQFYQINNVETFYDNFKFIFTKTNSDSNYDYYSGELYAYVEYFDKLGIKIIDLAKTGSPQLSILENQNFISQNDIPVGDYNLVPKMLQQNNNMVTFRNNTDTQSNIYIKLFSFKISAQYNYASMTFMLRSNGGSNQEFILGNFFTKQQNIMQSQPSVGISIMGTIIKAEDIVTNVEDNGDGTKNVSVYFYKRSAYEQFQLIPIKYNSSNDIVYGDDTSYVSLPTGTQYIASYMNNPINKINSLPTPSSNYRGVMLRIEGSSGIADSTYICKKLSDDTYTWKQIDI